MGCHDPHPCAVDLGDVGEVKENETPTRDSLPEDTFKSLRDRFAAVLGEHVRDVRESSRNARRPALERIKLDRLQMDFQP